MNSILEDAVGILLKVLSGSLILRLSFLSYTVPFNSVRQSRVTGPSELPKCHAGHGNFFKMPKSFGSQAPNIKNLRRLRRKTAENFRPVTSVAGS